jgi:hypothetical protein
MYIVAMIDETHHLPAGFNLLRTVKAYSSAEKD